MSVRRAATVSPLIGCLSNALPVDVQSFSVPDSKSRFSGRPSLPSGLMGSGVAATRSNDEKSSDHEVIRKSFIVVRSLSRCGGGESSGFSRVRRGALRQHPYLETISHIGSNDTSNHCGGDLLRNLDSLYFLGKTKS